jgi:ribonuclease HI
MKKTKYYAVAVGRRPGIYTRWFGKGGAQEQVHGFPGARYKSFPDRERADGFIREACRDNPPDGRVDSGQAPTGGPSDLHDAIDPPEAGRVLLYTDGSSLGNPGPGGYGVIIVWPGKIEAYSGGYRCTTNNRMELLACIVGLERVQTPSSVMLHSDSRYVVAGMAEGWAEGWRRNGWRTRNGSPARNVDLWERLLRLCEHHEVRWIWVKGHAGNPANERCDQLARHAAQGSDLPDDEGYLR